MLVGFNEGRLMAECSLLPFHPTADIGSMFICLIISLFDRTRGAFIAAVFAMQGTGILCAGAVGCIVSAIYNHAVPAPPFNVDPVASVPNSADFVWRAILMFGAVPAAATYYYRMKMPETARFTGNTNLATGRKLVGSLECDSSLITTAPKALSQINLNFFLTLPIKFRRTI